MLVPEVVRNKALAAGAAAWLDGLPELIAGLERDWGITVGRPFSDPTEAFVAEASGPGLDAVLKLMVPRPGDHARNEITVLRLAGGEGCARLLRADEARGALLIERLGPGLLATMIGLQPVGREMLATADYVSHHNEHGKLSPEGQSGARSGPNEPRTGALRGAPHMGGNFLCR